MPFNPYKVSTHSRLKAAGNTNYIFYVVTDVSTHSRLKAAGSDRSDIPAVSIKVSTHSRLKAAGLFGAFSFYIGMFQHTAA